MTSGFSRSDIVHESDDIAYVLLWEALISGTVDDTARRRGFNGKDIERIHKQVEKITLRLRSKAHIWKDTTNEADELEAAEESYRSLREDGYSEADAARWSNY